MMSPHSSPTSVVSSSSSSSSCSASSTPDSYKNLKRRSNNNTPVLELRGVRQLKYSSMHPPSPRSKSPPIMSRRLFSRTLQTTIILFALGGVSLFASAGVLLVSFDGQWIGLMNDANRNLAPQSWSISKRPTTVFWDGVHFEGLRHRILSDDPTLHVSPGDEATVEENMRATHHDPDCIPMASWQTESFPNCNLLHEIDIGKAVDEQTNEDLNSTSLELLGTGWFRSSWKWSNPRDTSVVLKTLRLDREFFDEYYDLHRRDALAMERLTHSPFVINIYGYCGQSAINELADFHWDSLEKFGRNLRGREGSDVNFLKLQLAASVALGLAHVHELEDDRRPSMVHYDVNPRNVAIVSGGKPKLNDFNIAEFLHYNPKTNQSCGFRSRLHEPWWRAPEEVTIGNDNLLDEKVDIYALGNLLYHILTTHSPRGKMKKERMDEVRLLVAKGVRPTLVDEFAKSKDTSIVAIRTAMHMCHEFDPKKRPSAREVSNLLVEAVSNVRLKRRKLKRASIGA